MIIRIVWHIVEVDNWRLDWRKWWCLRWYLSSHWRQIEIRRRFPLSYLFEKKNVNVIVTGPVGPGKTLLGLEAINIKKSHYKRKYAISSNDCKNKLRIIILLGNSIFGSQLKQQIEMSADSHKDCTVEIKAEYEPKSEDLTRIFQAKENYKSFSHTLIMLDEIDR